MKFWLSILRIVALYFLFTAISNGWSIGVQYLLSSIACLVWAGTAYIEALKGL